ncbi:hypothetical protein CAL29_18865 [Bordetella genomosp. 10]|uniref:Antitoxin Xre/MbcA/ParS-like toxin-binding domain-containing protein n=2 Tax=Bordetella genomosp. 10 TaxID=1416804 RepID=A0A261RYX9_9BORD|nr:hypothetical protein CAL29_18865 [Bordetella genomosp. 10]
MLERSREVTMEEEGWLSVAELTELIGLNSAHPHTELGEWIREWRVFLINHNGINYFPAYGLNHESGWRPREALKSILEIIADTKDGWGLAYWFRSNSSFLGGRRLQDVLAADPELVIAAARDEMEGVPHG